MDIGKGAATAEVAPGGAALLVALGGKLAILCVGTAIDLELRVVSVARAEEGCARMAGLAPRVVVAPGTLSHAERDTLARGAASCGAEIVFLPRYVDQGSIAHAMARAVATRGTREARQSRPDASADAQRDKPR